MIMAVWRPGLPLLDQTIQEPVPWIKLIVAAFQMIPVLGVRRLMGAKVVCFLSEKFLSLLRPTILLCRKRLIIRSITGNQNRETGEELWRKIFKNFTQKPPGRNIEGTPR